MITPQEVIAEYGQLTGIRFRPGVLPYDVEQQALTLAKYFELWELRLVVEWTRAKIRAGEEKRNGFSDLSLQWHRLIAERGDDRLTQFQQRLGLAMTWATKSRPSLIPREKAATQTLALPSAPTIAESAAADEPRNVDPVRVTELKHRISGGSAA